MSEVTGPAVGQWVDLGEAQYARVEAVAAKMLTVLEYGAEKARKVTREKIKRVLTPDVTVCKCGGLIAPGSCGSRHCYIHLANARHACTDNPFTPLATPAA